MSALLVTVGDVEEEMFGFIGRMTLLSTLFTPILAVVVVVAAEGGHGSYYLAKMLFPYTMASTAFTSYITRPIVCLGVLQFPAYGLILDWARSTGRQGQYAIAFVGIHLGFVALAFLISNPSFTP
jgi:hypothetical protein